MDLKYASELSRYQGCPPRSAQPRSLEAYRFVHADEDDERNFLPPARINPTRRFHGAARCDSNALSLFVSAETAVAHFQKLQGSNKNIHKMLGAKLASGELDEDDGLATPADKRGHFSLHEAIDADLGPKFSVIGDLPTGEQEQ